MAFVNRDINDTKDVTLAGIVFTIKTLPHKTYRALANKVTFWGRSLGNAADYAPEYLDKLYDAWRELVRIGIKGHSGIVDKTGRPIACALDAEGNVSPETLELYEQNNLVSRLGSEVFVYNTLSEDERKNLS